MPHRTTPRARVTRTPARRYARPRRQRAARLLGLLVGGLALLIGPGLATAQAHDELVSSSPADGTTVAQLPAAVVLTFEEPPAAVGIEVTILGPSGPAQSGSPQLAGSAVSQELAPGSPAGSYQVSWRVTSDDGHPVSGAFSFVATTGSATSTGSPSSSTTTSTSSSPTSSTTNSPSSSPSSSSTTTDPSTSVATTPPVVAAGSSETSGGWPVVVVILVVLAALVVGSVTVVVRRRRT